MKQISSRKGQSADRGMSYTRYSQQVKKNLSLNVETIGKNIIKITTEDMMNK